MMKRLLTLFLGIVVCGMTYAQIVPKVEVVNDISDYNGSAEKVYSQTDSKWYAKNNTGYYEEYGVVQNVNTLNVLTPLQEKQIEYIYQAEHTNSKCSYIATDYVPKANTRIIMDVNIDDYVIKDYQALFGARDGNWTQKAYCFFARFAGQWNGGWNRTNNEARASDEVIRGERIVVNTYREEVFMYFQDDDLAYNEYEDYGDEFFYNYSTGTVENSINPLFLFDVNTGSGAGSKQVDNSSICMKMYATQIYEVAEDGTETLVRDFVPYQFANGQYGLLDKVTGNKYQSARAGQNFTPSPDADTVEGVTTYPGKIVKFEGNYYEWENGAWVNKGSGGDWQEIVVEGVDSEGNEYLNYKDFTNWSTNNDHVGCYAGLEYDPDSDMNTFAPYHGTGGWEPLICKIPTEKGARYRYSFTFSCDEYGTWNAEGDYLTAIVMNNWDVNTQERGKEVGANGVLASFFLPHEATTDLEVEMEFTAEQDFEVLLNQFGLVGDDTDYYFWFSNVKVEKQGGVPSYPELEVPQNHMVFNTVAEAEAYPTLYDGQYIYIAENGFNTYKVTASGPEVVKERGDLPYPGQTVEVGNSYYIYSVDATYYPWLQGNNRNVGAWSTRLNLGTTGFDVKVTTQFPDGSFQLDPQFGANHSINYDNLYMDTGSGVSHWVLKPIVHNGVTAYLLTCGKTVLGPNDTEELVTDANENGLWQLVTEAERLADLQKATADNPVDATWTLGDSEFANMDDRLGQRWTNSGISEGGNQGRVGDGGYWCNRVYEFWNCPEVSFYNIILPNIPNGQYALSVQGYYRDGTVGADGFYSYEDGDETLRAYYYANDEEALLKSIYSEAVDEADGDHGFAYEIKEGEGDEAFGIGKFIPNSVDNASRAFYHEAYKNPNLGVFVEDGLLEVGIRKLESVEDDWVVVDKFKLMYYGPDPCDVTGVKDVTEAVNTPTDNSVYTISGMKVQGNKLNKGIYIINGKKQVVK